MRTTIWHYEYPGTWIERMVDWECNDQDGEEEITANGFAAERYMVFGPAEESVIDVYQAKLDGNALAAYLVKVFQHNTLDMRVLVNNFPSLMALLRELEPLIWHDRDRMFWADVRERMG